MSKIYTYKDHENFVKSLGYILITKENFKVMDKIIIQDNEGYFYTTTLSELKSNYKPRRYHKSNLYTIYNIKLCLSINNSKYKLIDIEYINNRKKMNLIDDDGFYYAINLYDLLNKNNFEKFYITNPYTIQNIKLWCKLNNKPFELLSESYKNAKSKLEWKCLNENCGEMFERSWDLIYRGGMCLYCVGHMVSNVNCLATKYPELIKEWHSTKNGDLTPYDVTCGYDGKKIWWKCKECGHEWATYIYNRVGTNKTGCPECAESKGEIKIREWLRFNNINYIPQKEFDGLVGLGEGNLSYDFYLPDYDLLIEYQGIQHEQYRRGFHKSKKDFEKQLEHDRRKKEYALNNNIKLLEIWYWDYDNIEEILEKNY